MGKIQPQMTEANFDIALATALAYIQCSVNTGCILEMFLCMETQHKIIAELSICKLGLWTESLAKTNLYGVSTTVHS